MYTFILRRSVILDRIETTSLTRAKCKFKAINNKVVYSQCHENFISWFALLDKVQVIKSWWIVTPKNVQKMAMPVSIKVDRFWLNNSVDRTKINSVISVWHFRGNQNQKIIHVTLLFIKITFGKNLIVTVFFFLQMLIHFLDFLLSKFFIFGQMYCWSDISLLPISWKKQTFW